jgi:apolipoprotein N-acyltransferase
VNTRCKHDGDVLVGAPSPVIPRGAYYNSIVSLGYGAVAGVLEVAPGAVRRVRAAGVRLGGRGDADPALILQSAAQSIRSPLAVAGEKVAINICYEDTFGAEIARQLPEATMLVNVSNVAWFGDSLAPAQHLQISRMRAHETGRPMLRATNTGMTAIIDHRTGETRRSKTFTEGALAGRGAGLLRRDALRSLARLARHASPHSCSPWPAR